MLNEFIDFIAKGNIMDLAVEITIGAAFTAIVQSLVGDLINPIIGRFLGGVDFTNLFVVLRGEGDFATMEAAREAGAAVFSYGAFIVAIINFLIIVFVLFMLLSYVNRVKEASVKNEEAVVKAAPGGSSKTDLLMEIRDALKR